MLNSRNFRRIACGCAKRWSVFSTNTLLILASCCLPEAQAQDDLDLKLSWKEDRLQIETEAFAGGTVDVWYLEAFCRSGAQAQDWEATLIPHATRLVYVNESRKKLRLKTVIKPDIEVEHEITAGPDHVQFAVTLRNRGATDADVQWAQPCVQVRIFSGADQEEYLAHAFIFTAEGPQYLDALPRAEAARYEGGQVFAPEGRPHSEMNPRPISSVTPTLPLIGCTSADGSMLLATAWSDTHELFQGVRNCIHSDFHVGGLAPGETKQLRGTIYLLPNDVHGLVDRYLEDFGGSAPAGHEGWSLPVRRQEYEVHPLLQEIPAADEEAAAMTGEVLAADVRPAEAAARALAPVPLVRAHAHNDYRHERPLLDALDAGFCSVEADVHLVDGELLVAHNRQEADPARTLRSLYLEPLRQRAEANGGRVYPDGPSVTLLIDIKSDGEKTYPVLKSELEQFRELLSRFTDNSTEVRAVTAIISGNVPRVQIVQESPRLMAIDGRPGDLDSLLNQHQVPLISASWRDVFTWLGQGPIRSGELAKLRELVERSHAEGRRIRFWGLPIRPAVWPVLYENGVDLINADNLQALSKFLLNARETEKQLPVTATD